MSLYPCPEVSGFYGYMDKLGNPDVCIAELPENWLK
jgi:hypothetical protein